MEIQILTEDNLQEKLLYLQGQGRIVRTEGKSDPSLEILQQTWCRRQAPILLKSPTAYCSAIKLKSELDSFLLEGPKLKQIERLGDKVGVALLVVLIADVADSLNIGKNMSGQQTIDAAQILLDEFPELKVNDVVLCFNKAKRGHYGKIYDRLDVQVLMEWLHRYEADQDEQIENYRQQENNRLKRETKDLGLIEDVASNEVALKWIREMKEKINPVKHPSAIKRVEVKQDEFSKWMGMFNRIYEKQNKGGSSGTRFVKRYGRFLDMTEFLQQKQQQFELVKHYLYTRKNKQTA